jgi:hypothetical protein
VPRSGRAALAGLAAASLLAAIVVVGAPVARAASYPVAPVPYDRELLSNLTAPSTGPGGSTSIGFRVSDPPHFGTLSGPVLTLEVYALNGYPGDAVGPVPVTSAPVLENGTASGEEVNLSLPALGPGESYNGSVAVATSATTPAGTYAVRTALAFTENGSRYLFESRGWFALAAWENATELPNGTATVNASRLGVSGVVPETAVYVAPSDWPLALGAVVALGLVLVGLGAWLYFRRGPGSRSGTGSPGDPGTTNAPSAFGSSRKSPGDSRSS